MIRSTCDICGAESSSPYGMPWKTNGLGYLDGIEDMCAECGKAVQDEEWRLTHGENLNAPMREFIFKRRRTASRHPATTIAAAQAVLYREISGEVSMTDFTPEERERIRAWLLAACREQERLSCYASTWTAWVRALCLNLGSFTFSR